MLTRKELIRTLRLALLSEIPWMQYINGGRLTETFTVGPRTVVVTVGKDTSFYFAFEDSEFAIDCGDTELVCCKETAFTILTAYLDCKLTESQIYKFVSLN